jgi:asparaginyl-tRNA synthetase
MCLRPKGYGEVIGGGERATSIEFLEQQIAAHGPAERCVRVVPRPAGYGSVPHGGFGMGVERCTAVDVRHRNTYVRRFRSPRMLLQD